MTDPTQFQYLPGIRRDLIDSSLAVYQQTRAPRVLVLGTASKGQTPTPYVVTSSSSAASAFGTEGTLTRGMYEARQAGAKNVILYRLGATSSKLEHVGDSTGAAGYTIETVRQDDDAGGIYTIWYDDGTDRLVVFNSTTALTVYDSDNLNADLGEVYVSGARGASGGPDIGGPSNGVALESVTATGTSYTAGTDGTTPSRMELFEYLYGAYAELLGQDFDYVIPMDVYIDDLNVEDGSSFRASYLSGIVSGGTYPTSGSIDDILGKIFVEEYQGEYYYFWDLDGDGQAELWPNGVGSASATTKISGESFTSADFHEVNFGYQLARFCHEVSANEIECLGTIGVRPPSDLSRASVTSWIGKLPTFSNNSLNEEYINSIVDNGSGLLGNKWMAGEFGFRTGSPAYGGFILTDSEWSDGIEEVDSRDQPIDLGKYLSVVAAWITLFNPVDTSGFGYAASAAPTYLGYVSTLDEKDAPTNNIVPWARPTLNLSPRLVDRLTQVGYVFIYERPKGLVISDAPTGARPLSDYRRLTTMRIVKRVIDVFRRRADPFIGKASNAPARQALETAVSDGLTNLVSGGYITRFELYIRQTALQRVTGEASAELIIVPAWELRRIQLQLSLKPE